MILPVKTQCRRHRRVMEVILLKQKQIKCPYCHAHASLRPASLVYGSTPQTRGKFLYVCDRWPSCNAYVSAHERTLLPMGTLANGDLRHKRILAPFPYQPIHFYAFYLFHSYTLDFVLNVKDIFLSAKYTPHNIRKQPDNAITVIFSFIIMAEVSNVTSGTI